ncbi:cupin domain-containing protein [Kerstersia gyiorum]|uniref:Cupin type-2 domain-containing protein n=1 Tax=Kerstersia gyiorum TaxID=206506 RepID=A0A171KUQ3_9BURK|nr:cupin domain-containing protein [Kerstersia gyiorum]KKO72620.1 hypothetical protein AAV32_06265 [Kerstersia gyiorum]MCP1634132.1 putative cupin superfamily protein [Kerstersia gyiorum]MCP1637710.1 putative cupin superfamily protein [Kerstersia gyiorum]MCP1670584.1 putative cupin superfamily protein [Kerstersia gyiorum]MCP1678763.1 putative cupin superfamily protein [Kerstersia gyiorum]
MIRCVHLFTGADGQSYFEEGLIDLPKGERGDTLSAVAGAVSISFRETSEGGSFDWHEAPAHQFVLTLSGTLEFETRGGEHFQLSPGDVLWAEDTTGGGHRWRLIGNDPWRRAYVILAQDAKVLFAPAKAGN